jgi:hypothetical protein
MSHFGSLNSGEVVGTVLFGTTVFARRDGIGTSVCGLLRGEEDIWGFVDGMTLVGTGRDSGTTVDVAVWC